MIDKEILSFEKLPEAVLKLMDEVHEIKRLLRKENESETTKLYCFNSENIVPFFKEFGIKMSKSRLYKLTSKHEIPFSKIGNQLLFEKDELLKWITKHKIDSAKERNPSINSLCESARKKSNSKTIKNG